MFLVSFKNKLNKNVSAFIQRSDKGQNTKIKEMAEISSQLQTSCPTGVM